MGYSSMQSDTTLPPFSALYADDRGICTFEVLISTNQGTRFPDLEGRNMNM